MSVFTVTIRAITNSISTTIIKVITIFSIALITTFRIFET